MNFSAIGGGGGGPGGSIAVGGAAVAGRGDAVTGVGATGAGGGASRNGLRPFGTGSGLALLRSSTFTSGISLDPVCPTVPTVRSAAAPARAAVRDAVVATSGEPDRT